MLTMAMLTMACRTINSLTTLTALSTVLASPLTLLAAGRGPRRDGAGARAEARAL